jgi:hypothetical protein
MKAPYCKDGSRRCPISKKCMRKKTIRRTQCKKGRRKCADSKCYNKNKSLKSRNNFYEKYV